MKQRKKLKTKAAAIRAKERRKVQRLHIKNFSDNLKSEKKLNWDLKPQHFSSQFNFFL